MKSQHSKPTGLSLVVAFTAVSLLGARPATAQNLPRPTAVAACERACGITLDLEMEYGDDSGPGILDLVGRVEGYRDASGRMYIVGHPIDNVVLFAPDGRFLRRFGRSGSGPGELKDGSSFVLTGDGEFSVLDRGRGAILNYDHTGRLRSEARTEGWVPSGIRTFAWDGPRVVHVADLGTPDHVGFPLHLVNVETGEIERSFGSVTGEKPLGGDYGWYPVAIREDRWIWMGVGFERYELALWDMNRPHRLLQRKATWFPELTRDDFSHYGPPQPALYALALSEADSLLWVLGSVADEKWSEADPYSTDFDAIFDDILEVIDLRTNKVIATQRFDRSFHLMEAGLLGRPAITENASVRYQVWRARPEAAAAR